MYLSFPKDILSSVLLKIQFSQCDVHVMVRPNTSNSIWSVKDIDKEEWKRKEWDHCHIIRSLINNENTFFSLEWDYRRKAKYSWIIRGIHFDCFKSWKTSWPSKLTFNLLKEESQQLTYKDTFSNGISVFWASKYFEI